MATETTPAKVSQAQIWGQLVRRVNSVDTPKDFLAAMLDLQCRIVAAKCGAMWVAQQGGSPGLALAWPQKLVDAPPDSPLKQLLARAAASGFERGVSHVLKIEPEDAGPERDVHGYIAVTVMRHGDKVTAVSTTVAECRDPQVIRQTTPMRELAAGLYETFEARRRAEGFRMDAEQVRRAMALLAVAQDGRGFNGAALNLVNELARQYDCTRVTLGWVKGNAVRAVAMSDTSDLKRHSEQVALVESAMAEALDQQQPIVYPVPDEAEPLLAHAVLHAHRSLAGEQRGRCTLSIPLRDGEELVGVLTFEKTDTTIHGFPPEPIRQLQLVADAVGPFMSDRRAGDRWLAVHAWHSVRDAAEYVVGPKHVGWKMLALGVLGLLAVVTFCTWPYKITADFALEANSKRIVPAPYQATIEDVRVEPGNRVATGDLLATLDATELKLQLAEAEAELRIHLVDRSQATAERKQAEAQQAQAAIEQARARINLLTYRIDHATIRSPIDGYILAGKWHDKIGGVVEQGEQLFEIAPLHDLIAVAKVDESDINAIAAMDRLAGVVAARSMPAKGFDVEVIQIVPLANPVEAKNVFEVRCRIEDPAPWLRPGMEGLAKIEAGDRRIGWILTHRIVDTLRLWLWI